MMYSGYKSSVEEYMMQGRIAEFMYRVYGWMTAALMVTAAVAYYVVSTPSLLHAVMNNGVLITLFIVQLALVVGLSMFLHKMSYTTAVVLFFIYAASVGFTLSVIFLVYTASSIALTFLVTALMFGSMCVYGYFTKTDLTSMGNMAGMAVWGLMLAMLLNIYFQSQTMDFIISGIGVLLFTALTAYDSQQIKQMGFQLLGDEQTVGKVSIRGALRLYLDFLNLFLFLLRFLGNRRES